MDKKTQDLTWASLPKEARDRIKIAYKSDYVSDRGYQPTRGMEVLQNVFGHHNLTSDTEPSELIYADRQKTRDFIGALYENARKSGSESELQAYQMAINYLEELFGDKCLPDKETPVQAEPKFKIGDKVIVLGGLANKDMQGKVAYVTRLPKEKYNYFIVTFENGLWTELSEKYLEPYTEPSNVSTNDTKDDTKDSIEEKAYPPYLDRPKKIVPTMEEKEHRNKALYDALCELESASVKVRKALIAL